jgi:hypothetical protein
MTEEATSAALVVTVVFGILGAMGALSVVIGIIGGMMGKGEDFWCPAFFIGLVVFFVGLIGAGTWAYDYMTPTKQLLDALTEIDGIDLRVVELLKELK